jgi:hypothetical protein
MEPQDMTPEGRRSESLFRPEARREDSGSYDGPTSLELEPRWIRWVLWGLAVAGLLLVADIAYLLAAAR